MEFKLNIDLLKHCTAQKDYKVLAWFIKLKYCHRNSVIYRFSYRSAARGIGCSVSSLRRQVRRMERLGWCFIQQGDLQISSIKQIREQIGVQTEEYVKVNYNHTIKELVLELKRAILKRSLTRQHHMISGLSDLIKLKPRRGDPEGAEEGCIASAVLHEISSGVSMSVAGLSDLLNVSKSAAQRVKKAFTIRGWYYFVRNYIITHRRVLLEWYLANLSRRRSNSPIWWYRGNVYRMLPCLVREGPPPDPALLARAYHSSVTTAIKPSRPSGLRVHWHQDRVVVTTREERLSRKPGKQYWSYDPLTQS